MGIYKLLGADALSDAAYGIWSFLPYLGYRLWLGCAWFVDIIEGIFRKLVGLGETYDKDTGNAVADQDFASQIIRDTGVRQIFGNLVAFATVMLIFFTILQIIREHYKDKNGGNPYIVVFRMVKGLVMFIFIYAACLVGVQVSSIVLRALDRATGHDEHKGISAQIFQAMSAQAGYANMPTRNSGGLQKYVNAQINGMRAAEGGTEAGIYFLVMDDEALGKLASAGVSDDIMSNLAAFLNVAVKVGSFMIFGWGGIFFNSAFASNVEAEKYIGNCKTLYTYYLEEVAGKDSNYSKDYDSYDYWISEQMKSGSDFAVLKIDTSGLVNTFFPTVRVLGGMSYSEPDLVSEMYDVTGFNFIVGFGGILVALGVFNSFAFGLIQRLMELGILFMFSPVTVAFYPIDDGAAFNNSFVKPFYKKVISSYAPILSLNLYFVIHPAVTAIHLYPPRSARDVLTQMIISVALLSMLPKARTAVQTMLGADPMEEKKMFGKNSVMGDVAKKYNPFDKESGLRRASAKLADYKKQLGIRGRTIGSDISDFKENAKKKFNHAKNYMGDKDYRDAHKKARKKVADDKKAAHRLARELAKDKPDQEKIRGIINGNEKLRNKYASEAKLPQGSKLEAKDISKLRENGFLLSDGEKLQREYDEKFLEGINGDHDLRRKFLRAAGHKGKLKTKQVSHEDLEKLSKMEDRHGNKLTGGAILDREEMLKDRRMVKSQDIRKRQELEKNKLQDKMDRDYYQKHKDDDEMKRADGSVISEDEFVSNLNNSKRDMLGINRAEVFKPAAKIKGLGKAAQSAISKSAVLGTIFDRDNGWFFKTGLGQMIDEHSFHKIFQGVDKIEKDRTKRLEDEAYAKMRSLRFVNAAMFNMNERAQLDQNFVEAKKYTKDKYDKDVSEAAAQRVRGGEILKEASGGELDTNVIAELGKGLDKETQEKKQKLGYQVAFTGTNEEIRNLFGDALGQKIIAAKMQLDADVKLKAQVDDMLGKTSELDRKYGLRHRSGEWQSDDALQKEYAARIKKLDEFEDVGRRMLGISDKKLQKIAQARDYYLGTESAYQQVLYAYQNGHNGPLKLKNGDIIEDFQANKNWFAQYQRTVHEEFEKIVERNVNYNAVAFRDYQEKTGDRLDGLVASKMAGEQVKLMLNTVANSSVACQQLFSSEYFVDCVKKSNYQELADQLKRAAQGQANNLDKKLLSAINNKTELEDLSLMFSQFYGDANGEMRGGGFAAANNIIAGTFRMAFVDQMKKAFAATQTLLDQEQTHAQNLKNTAQQELDGMKDSADKLIRSLVNVTDEVTGESVDFMKISQWDCSGDELDRRRKLMLDNFEKMTAGLDAQEKQNYISIRDKINAIFSNEVIDRHHRKEGDIMKHTVRELDELDILLRHAGGRIGDPRQ